MCGGCVGGQANLQRLVGTYSPTPAAHVAQPSDSKQEMEYAIVDFFNVVLGNSKQQQEFWWQILLPCVEAVYQYRFQSSSSSASLLSRFHKPQLFTTLQV